MICVPAFEKLKFLSAVFVAISILSSGTWAQTTTETESDGREEVVVKGEKPESLKRKERLQMHRLRAQLLSDFRKNESFKARFALADNSVEIKSRSRFKWGYDATEDAQRQQEIISPEQDLGPTQATTLFRAKF